MLPGSTELLIGDRPVGCGHRCFVIAEAGVNHDGSLDRAKALVDAAARAGADAVKFQTFNTDKVLAAEAPLAAYQAERVRDAKTQAEMVRRLELRFDDFAELNRHCSESGIVFMSTPFDEESADFLEALGMAAFKVGSGELTNPDLIKHIAAKHRPMIVSTGMATIGEVEQALRWVVEEAGNERVALLHCLSSYPAPPDEMNLRAMATLRAAFGVPVGFSDHSLGSELPIAAVALGACVVEKHLTLDRNAAGPDHAASTEPDAFASMIQAIRHVEAALGDGVKRPRSSELDTRRVARRSLALVRDLQAGAILGEEDIALRRPGTGLPVEVRGFVVGRRLRRAVAAGNLLVLDMLE